MGHNLQYIYKDIDKSYEYYWAKLDPIDKVSNYLEISLFDIDLAVTRTNDIIEIFTTYRYNAFEKGKIASLEKKLSEITNSRVFRLNECLLDEWNTLSKVEYWEDDEELISDFFDWLHKQDQSQWTVL